MATCRSRSPTLASPRCSTARGAHRRASKRQNHRQGSSVHPCTWRPSKSTAATPRRRAMSGRLGSSPTSVSPVSCRFSPTIWRHFARPSQHEVTCPRHVSWRRFRRRSTTGSIEHARRAPKIDTPRFEPPRLPSRSRSKSKTTTSIALLRLERPALALRCEFRPPPSAENRRAASPRHKATRSSRLDRRRRFWRVVFLPSVSRHSRSRLASRSALVGRSNATRAPKHQRRFLRSRSALPARRSRRLRHHPAPLHRAGGRKNIASIPSSPRRDMTRVTTRHDPLAQSHVHAVRRQHG